MSNIIHKKIHTIFNEVINEIIDINNGDLYQPDNLNNKRILYEDFNTTIDIEQISEIIYNLFMKKVHNDNLIGVNNNNDNIKQIKLINVNDGDEINIDYQKYIKQLNNLKSLDVNFIKWHLPFVIFKIINNVNDNNDGVFEPSDNEIYVPIRIGFINKILSTRKNIDNKKISTALHKMTLPIIMHELQHAYDYFRSNYNAKNTKKFIKTKSSYNKIKNPTEKQKEQYYFNYINQPHELHAFFIQTLKDTPIFNLKTGELIPLNDFYKSFIKNYGYYKYVNYNNRKRLNTWIASYYHKMQDKLNNK